ncbi:MAG: glyoxalase superfamily protein [Nevskia sp.]|nr:glyoxalase superfamily protein [Nevskia sp.]
MQNQYLSQAAVKQQAKLVAQFFFEQDGIKMPHSKALEAMSRAHGYRNWQTAQADLPEETPVVDSTLAQREIIAERIRNYRQERLANIHGHNTPVMVQLGCKLVLHVIPFSAFASRKTLDIRASVSGLTAFHPLGRNAHQNYKFTVDGVLNYANLTDDRSHAYCHVQRNGIVEAVSVFTSEGDGNNRIHSKRFEEHLITSLGIYLPLLMKLDLVPPFYVFIALVGGTHFDFIVPTDDGVGFRGSKAEMEFLAPPEALVSSTDEAAHRVLWPAIDVIWNAFGYPGSRNFTEQGEWIHRRR